MKVIVCLMLALIAVVPAVATSNTVHKQERCVGIWASGAKSPYIGRDFIPTKIPAPDGRTFINASNEGVALIGKKGSSKLNILVNPPLMEVLWAPDSRKFVINVSDGGLVGTWETYLYLIDVHGQPVQYNLRSIITPISSKILQCEPSEEANIGIAAWLNDSKEVLLIVEVPPHSSCRNMGAITGFRVSVETGKIMERIPEQGLRQKWVNFLGCRFKEHL